MSVKRYLAGILMLFCTALPLHGEEAVGKKTVDSITLTPQHIEALNRQRRIIFQDDVLALDALRTETVGAEQLAKVVDVYMSRLDEESNQIDSVWHEWGEGNTAVWPSKILPRTKNVFPKWWEAGLDPVQVMLEQVKRRGREVFFSYRINGSDNDPQFDPPHRDDGSEYDQPIPLKAEHPDWLLRKRHFFWNFSVKEVRDLKLSILREVAEMYDFDGIQVDFARGPMMFPAGQQWVNRDLLTDFVRRLRVALLEVEKKRGRPFLLAVRVPDNLMGCHFDGMDVETWAHENLVDMLVLGNRSSDVDIAAFRKITASTPIKLFPSWDDHHSSDGYTHASIEVYRGVYANWWSQKPDGVHTFNLMSPSPQTAHKLGLASPRWETQCQVFREVGSPETLTDKDKIFFVQRRGGGHLGIVPHLGDWHTARDMYFFGNMIAPLPAVLANDGKADTLLTLKVADDVNAAAERIEEITLRLVISDPAAEGLPDSEKIEMFAEEFFGGWFPGWPISAMPSPKQRPVRGIEKLIEVRINNILLGSARVDKGWLVFSVQPRCLAVGDNLVGVRVPQRPPDVRDQIRIEKLELHVNYR